MTAQQLADGYGGYLVLTLIGFLAHEPWRWAGLVLGRNVTLDSEIFHWVRAVATALVAGLVVRLIFFPTGALAETALGLRLAALAAGSLVFLAAGRSLGAGVAAGAMGLLVLRPWFSA